MERAPVRLVVICPIYNEEQNIGYFFERMKKTFEQLDQTEYSCLLVFTNNRSTDRSLALLEKLREDHDWVGYITLSRNHGYQLSVLAGLSTIPADFYMICDVDCEDPPEMLHEFLLRMHQGHDLAYGIRNNRQESWLIGRCRSLFYHGLRALGDYRIVPYMAEFAMFKRPIRDVVIAGNNSAPFLRADFGYAGFNIVGVPYRRQARRFGVTHYSFLGNVGFAIAGALASTTFPLRAVFYALPAVWAINLTLCLMFAQGAIGFGAAVVSLLCVNTLYMSGAMAFLSIYLARTYQNGLGRERFIVDGSLSRLPRTVVGHTPEPTGSAERLKAPLTRVSCP